jgi:hypothetical protein
MYLGQITYGEKMAGDWELEIVALALITISNLQSTNLNLQRG